MARILRFLKTKTVVSLPGLELFLESFDPAAVRAIIDLVELGADHPNFGKAGEPGAIEYQFADEATDALLLLYEEEDAVDEIPEDPPHITIDCERATIAIHNRWYRPPSRRRGRSPVPSLRTAVDRVAVRLLRKPDGKN